MRMDDPIRLRIEPPEALPCQGRNSMRACSHAAFARQGHAVPVELPGHGDGFALIGFARALHPGLRQAQSGAIAFPARFLERPVPMEQVLPIGFGKRQQLFVFFGCEDVTGECNPVANPTRRFQVDTQRKRCDRCDYRLTTVAQRQMDALHPAGISQMELRRTARCRDQQPVLQTRARESCCCVPGQPMASDKLPAPLLGPHFRQASDLRFAHPLRDVRPGFRERRGNAGKAYLDAVVQDDTLATMSCSNRLTHWLYLGWIYGTPSRISYFRFSLDTYSARTLLVS